mgnify:CR=1 FL=1
MDEEWRHTSKAAYLPGRIWSKKSIPVRDGLAKSESVTELPRVKPLGPHVGGSSSYVQLKGQMALALRRCSALSKIPPGGAPWRPTVDYHIR